ncbi:unnamed protein product [Bathycoccus prasinos]
MSSYNRICMLKQAKACSAATTFADFIGIYPSSTATQVPMPISPPGPCHARFKEILFGFIDGFSPSGSCVCPAGLKEAFKLVDDSNEKNYGAGSVAHDGVAGVDATVCDLLQNKVPDPTGSTRTQRGCTCRETYTYHEKMFSGCTTTDWPVPWCATSGICGSCNTDSVEGGCWDDCEPEGKEGVLQEELLARSGRLVQAASLDVCALEALKDWRGRIQDPDSTTYNLKSVQSSLQGTLYDMNADECECDDTMQPTCACAAIKEINQRSKTCSGGDSSRLNMGLLFGILIPYLLCCFGFIWKIICRKKRVPPHSFIRSASTMVSCAGYNTSAGYPLPTG